MQRSLFVLPVRCRWHTWYVKRAQQVERLSGGQVTSGVLRMGATVHRPVTRNAAFVQELLNFLERAGFDGAPRALGFDEAGRQVLTYIEGVVPHGEERHNDTVLVKAAGLLRRFHDATALSSLKANCEVVCHGDAGPHNMVFANGLPVAMIDWGDARPGCRLADIADAVWGFTNIACDGQPPGSHAPRIVLFSAAYGDIDPVAVAALIERKIRQALANHLSAQRLSAAAAFMPWVEWFDTYSEQLRGQLR